MPDFVYDHRTAREGLKARAGVALIGRGGVWQPALDLEMVVSRALAKLRTKATRETFECSLLLKIA